MYSLRRTSEKDEKKEILRNIKLLLKRGADLNWQDPVTQKSCMHVVPDSEVAKLLAEYGARADIPDVCEQYPLHVVASRISSECIDPKKVEGRENLFVANTGPERLYLRMTIGEQREFVRFMVSLYPDAIHARDNNGHTPLNIYLKEIREGHFPEDPEIVRMLGVYPKILKANSVDRGPVKSDYHVDSVLVDPTDGIGGRYCDQIQVKFTPDSVL